MIIWYCGEPYRPIEREGEDYICEPTSAESGEYDVIVLTLNEIDWIEEED